MSNGPLIIEGAEVLFSQLHNDFITKAGKNLGRSVSVLATDELLNQIKSDSRVAAMMKEGFTDLNLKPRLDKDGNETGENMIVFKLKPFQSGQRPKIVDKANQATLEEATFRQKINLSVFPGSYENTFKGGAKSISFKVIGLQLLDKPEVGSVDPGFIALEEPAAELNL